MGLITTQYGQFEIKEDNGKFLVHRLPDNVIPGSGYYIGTFASREAAEEACRNWRPIVDPIRWRSNDEHNTTVTITRDELIISSTQFGEIRHPLQDVVMVGQSESSFIAPSEIGTKQIITTVRFDILSTGQSYTFSGPGIDEFHNQVQKRIQETLHKE